MLSVVMGRRLSRRVTLDLGMLPRVRFHRRKLGLMVRIVIMAKTSYSLRLYCEPPCGSTTLCGLLHQKLMELRASSMMANYIAAVYVLV